MPVNFFDVLMGLQGQGKVLGPAELVRAVREGAGLESMGAAQQTGMEQARRQQDIEAETLAVVTELESAWSGQGGAAAQEGLRPLANAATSASSALGGSQGALADQAQVFQSTRDGLRDVKSDVPERSCWDTITPWDTDTEDMINQHQAAVSHNLELYNQFDQAADANNARMPTDYGQIGDRAGGAFTLQDPSADGGTSGGPGSGLFSGNTGNTGHAGTTDTAGSPTPAGPGAPGGGGQPAPAGFGVTPPSSPAAPVPHAAGQDHGSPSPGAIPGGQPHRSVDPATRAAGSTTPSIPGTPSDPARAYQGPIPTGPGHKPAGMSQTGVPIPGMGGRPGLPGTGARGGYPPHGGPSGSGGRPGAVAGPGAGQGPRIGGSSTGSGIPGSGNNPGPGGSGSGVGSGKATGGGPVPAEPGPRAPSAGSQPTSAGSRTGTPGMPMSPAGGGRGKDDEDGHMPASYLKEPDPHDIFGTDQPTVPPVIGA